MEAQDEASTLIPRMRLLLADLVERLDALDEDWGVQQGVRRTSA